MTRSTGLRDEQLPRPVTMIALRARPDKFFRSGSEEVIVLDDLSVEVQAGEFVALVGESGSGKTTLLHLVGCAGHSDEG